MQSLPEFPWHLLPELEQTLILAWDHKRPWKLKVILRKNKAEGFMLPEFQPHYKVRVIRTVWHRLRNRHVGQWHRTESPEIDRQLYGLLIFDKAGKNAP